MIDQGHSPLGTVWFKSQTSTSSILVALYPTVAHTYALCMCLFTKKEFGDMFINCQTQVLLPSVRNPLKLRHSHRRLFSQTNGKQTQLASSTGMSSTRRKEQSYGHKPKESCRTLSRSFKKQTQGNCHSVQSIWTKTLWFQKRTANSDRSALPHS